MDKTGFSAQNQMFTELVTLKRIFSVLESEHTQESQVFLISPNFQTILPSVNAVFNSLDQKKKKEFLAEIKKS